MKMLIQQPRIRDAVVAKLIMLGLLLLVGCKADISVQEEPLDPVVQEFPLAFVERPLLLLDDNGDEEPLQIELFEPARFNGGAKLILKKNAFAQSEETDLLATLFAADALYDVKDLAVSPDGNTLVFSVHPPMRPNVDEDEQPTWSLYKYDVKTKQVSPLIANESQRELGHDIQPAFLPDGRIIFSSTRQTTSRQILLDEFKPQYTAQDEDRDGPTFNLHVMDIDGDNLTQISFNLSHDLAPTVLPDGNIVYVRWDNQSDRNMLNLYRMRPDGSRNELLYGWHSHSTGADQNRVEFTRPQVLADGSLSVLLTTNNAPYYNTWPQQIAYADASDNTQALYNKTLIGNAQTPLFPWAFDNTQRAERAGAVHSFFALHDGTNRYLVSWSPCRATLNSQTVACAQLPADSTAPLAAPLYGLWLFDNEKKTQVPVRLGIEGKIQSEPTVLQARNKSPFLPTDPRIDPLLAAENAAILQIRSVYDIAGTASVDLTRVSDPMQTRSSDRPVRYVRFIRGVPLPSNEVQRIPGFAFGVSQRQGMRDILGFAPVEPDGSVAVKVPANVPLALSLLDASGKAVSAQHQQWITLRPGETLSCNGCHQANNTRPHGRYNGEGEWPSANVGATQSSQAFFNANPAMPAHMGETMAQAAARLLGVKPLSEGLMYQDLWTDPARRTPESATVNSYTNLTTATPVGTPCFSQWQAHCRIRIDYPEHIAPLWSLERVTRDDTTGEVITDHTCISCHSRTDAAGEPQIPAGQLELTAQPSDLQARHQTSYRELVSNDFELALVEGVLIDKQVQAVDGNGTPLFVRDANGNLVLDDEGNPIPILTRVPVSASMAVGNARGSNRFFNKFAADGTHAGFLTAAELRLLADWLDIGAQYYNSPFVVPE